MKSKIHEHKKNNKNSVSKNLFISILCFISTILSAQEKESTLNEEWQNPNWKLILSKLDTTQIKSGVLIDSS
jgi:hypothetical protein